MTAAALTSCSKPEESAEYQPIAEEKKHVPNSFYKMPCDNQPYRTEHLVFPGYSRCNKPQ